MPNVSFKENTIFFNLILSQKYMLCCFHQLHMPCSQDMTIDERVEMPTCKILEILHFERQFELHVQNRCGQYCPYFHINYEF